MPPLQATEGTRDPFYDPSAFFPALTDERLEEIRALVGSWRLNELGKVSRRDADQAYEAVRDLLDELERRGPA